MSVIHEALEKKGIDCVRKIQGEELPHIVPLPPEFARRRGARKKGIPVRAAWMAAGAILLGLIIFSLGFVVFQAFQARSASSSPIVAAGEIHSPRARTDAPVQTPSRRGEFVLSGIIEGENNLAVINDKVVGAGDRIGSAIVKEIQGRRVILESRGKEIRLSL